MSDILIVHQFENMIINVFGMHFDFIILHVSIIMEVPLLGLQIEPCLKCLLEMSMILHVRARRVNSQSPLHNTSKQRATISA